MPPPSPPPPLHTHTSNHQKANTKVVAYVLVAAIILTAVIPAWLLGPILQVWFGVSFFIKAYVFNKYPALKAKYDSTYNFWCGLPDKTTVNYTVSPPAATAASAAGGGSKRSAAGNGKAKGKVAEVSAQPYSTTAGTVAAARSRAGQASNSNAAATATATATAASASASGSASSAAHAGSGAAAAAAVGAGAGGDSASDSIGSWSCVYLNDKVTASKAGRLVLSTTHVYFKTRDEGTSLFNVPLKDLVAVMPGDVLKASQEGKSSWLSSTLAKVGGKLGCVLNYNVMPLSLRCVCAYLCCVRVHAPLPRSVISPHVCTWAASVLVLMRLCIFALDRCRALLHTMC